MSSESDSFFYRNVKTGHIYQEELLDEEENERTAEEKLDSWKVAEELGICPEFIVKHNLDNIGILRRVGTKFS